MKSIFRALWVLTALVTISACTTTWQQLEKQSEQAYPHDEWRRPPAHWSPP